MRARTFLVLALVAALVALSGCGAAKPAAKPSTQPATAASNPEDTSGPIVDQEYSPADDIAYIRGLGKTHRGETLWAVIAATSKTKDAATKALADLLTRSADPEIYYVIEPTEHLTGLKAGSWVVAEFHYGRPVSTAIELVDGGPIQATVKQVTVACDDPIPVYEDQVGDSAP